MIGNTKKSTCVSTVCHAGKENPPDRRAVVRGGMKRALATPILSTVLAARTYAGDYGCYALERQYSDRGRNSDPCCAAPPCQADGGSPTEFSRRP